MLRSTNWHDNLPPGGLIGCFDGLVHIYQLVLLTKILIYLTDMADV